MYVSIDYRKRILQLQSEMEKADLDIYVAVKNGSISYLLGAFAPWRSAVIVPLKGEPIAVLWNKDFSRLKLDTWMQDTVPWSDKTGGFVKTVCDVIKKNGFKSKHIGLELSVDGDRIAPGLLYSFEMDVFKGQFPNSQLKDSTYVLDQLMVVKDTEEIKLMRQAAAIADAGIRACLDNLEQGITETELLGYAEFEMRRLGAEWFWSVTGGNEVGSGYRTWYPGGVTQPATGKIIQNGEIVILDLHPMIQLYYADFAVNAIVGDPSPAQVRLGEVWETAVETLLESMKPGVTISEVSKQVSAYLDSTEYSEQYTKTFGHGIGTCSRIPHVIHAGNNTVLEQNMVLNGTIHVYEEGIGGMRLEIPILIGEKEAEPLCKIPLKLHRVN